MTNEQLLLEIGRMMGSTVRDAIQESEERMKLYIHDVVQASEQRTKVETDRLSQQIQEVDGRLSASVKELRDAVHHAMEDMERMAQQIAATA